MSNRFLKYAKITSFGAFFNKIVGPFSPTLNVVYGQNESGKTTFASFVSGILFGWENARGSKNTYKPENAERAGSLFFAEREENGTVDGAVNADSQTDTDQQEWEFSRVRNADGLQGDVGLLGDLDKRTYQTVFSLTSDELRSLDGATNLTSRLLTAGAGTAKSPALVLEELDEKIATYTSRAAGNPHSIVQLRMKLNEMDEQIRLATQETDNLKNDDREFHRLQIEREDIAAQVACLDGRIKRLQALRTQIETNDGQLTLAKSDYDAHRKRQAEMMAEWEAEAESSFEYDQDAIEGLMSLSTSEERHVRDMLDVLVDKQVKAQHGVDLAREDCVRSVARFEALSTQEAQAVADGGLGDMRERRRKFLVQAVLSIVFPLIFAAIGVPLFMRGRQIGSLSFTAVGAALTLCAVALAVIALFLLFRPDRTREEREAKLRDAQWVKLQDEKRLEACLSQQDCVEQEISQQLEEWGLTQAYGSLRIAREMLDEAKSQKTKAAMRQQRQAAVALHCESQLKVIDELEVERITLMDALVEEGVLGADADDRYGAERFAEARNALDAALEACIEERETALKTGKEAERRFGELGLRLEQAKQARTLDHMKLEAQQIRTRMEESKVELARLLLARRMVKESVDRWEKRSQPEVYRQAGRLLSLMTDGRWMKVRLDEEEHLVIEDSVHTVRDPQHLSMGTCQQLYLALRMALLMCAPDAGRSIPVLADDILVNFDDERRKGAVLALKELSQFRQVILFTCHKEVVRVVREIDSDVTLIEL